ncbi:pisatin demethylase [Setomelanomma holmii]|uniref:Pisatin demethylase n=1 Tax=Setomelanomma holmii TaxID=210430 RepID=A0A9P4LL20_9PLEO|nr:pisatin demethylase [Setomelanomma holmii]
MLLLQFLEHLSPLLIITILFPWVTAHLIYNKYGTRLNHIPGPFWASFSDFYRLYIVWGRRPERWHIQLHEQYGELVRIGPKTVICSSNKAAKKVYALNAGFVKSEFYPVQRALSKGVPLVTLFTSTDEIFHAKLRRAVNNAYAMSSLVQFEPLVDSTIAEFLVQMRSRNFVHNGVSTIFDFGEWLQYFAFDVICELTYSKRMGFVDRGEDVENIISDLQWVLNYAAVIGQVPILDNVFLKNPIRKLMSAWGWIRGTPVAHFALRRIAETQAEAQDSTEKKYDPSTAGPRRDFLSRFQEAHTKEPDFISNERVLALTVANMIAGSDTTATSLRAIFYNLVCNPDKLEKLRTELNGVWAKRDVQRPGKLLTWEEVRELPYLSAVINESLRTHPAAGLALERIVPANGLHIGETVIPGGTNIGCNAWVLHLDEHIWGPHPDEWKPERWTDATANQKAEMKNSLFTFGAGARTCIGKNVSYLEMYKLVPAVLREFDIKLAYPDKEWTLHNAWFVKQSDFYVKLQSRQ